MHKDEAHAILCRHHYPPSQLIRQKTSRHPLWYAETPRGPVALKMHPDSLRIAKLMHYLGKVAAPLPVMTGTNYLLIPWLPHQSNTTLTYQHMLPIIQEIAEFSPPISLIDKTKTPSLSLTKDRTKKGQCYQYLKHQLKNPPINWQKTRLFYHHDMHPNNILIYDNTIHLIDWEFASYQDPAYLYMDACLSLTYDKTNASLTDWANHWQATPIDWPNEHTIYAFYSVLYRWLCWEHYYGSTHSVLQCIESILNDPNRLILFPARTHSTQ